MTHHRTADQIEIPALEDRHRDPALATEVTKRQRRKAFWRRLLSDRLTTLGLVALTLIVAAVVVGPLLWNQPPNAQDLTSITEQPSWQHPLGTDRLGRDVLSRVLHGGRVSLGVALVAVVLSMVTGGAIGLISGFVRGRTDSVVMRIMDVMIAMPPLMLAVLIAATLGSGIRNTALAVVIPGIPANARVIRSVVLSTRERDYVFAAWASGVRPSRILLRHVLPNCMSTVLAVATLSVSVVLLTVAGLGYLGLGVQPPSAEWGAMLSDGQVYIVSRPLVVLVPGLAIFLTALSANLVGDGLRDAFDPSR